MIPYGKQEILDEDIEAVIDVLRSDFITQGPLVDQFEHSVASYCGAKYASAVHSATAALHISLLAIGVEPGDLVWTSPNSFVASANAALYCGAKIDFVDIDPLTFNMSVDKLEEKLITAKKTGLTPKVVIPVHFAGRSCEMKKIRDLSIEYNFYIVEDASHAIGGNYLNDKIGKCEFSDVTVFSFHPVKIITTGEGGMALTNNKDIADRLRLFRSHGITRDKKLMLGSSDGDWYYQQLYLGYNYRMTDIQAALGISQLKRIDSYVARRHEVAAFYNKELVSLPITLPEVTSHIYSAFHLYVIKVDKYDYHKREDVFNAMREKNILVNVHYIPIHMHPFYLKLGFSVGDFPNSEDYYNHAISLPMYSSITSDQLMYVVESLKEILAQ